MAQKQQHYLEVVEVEVVLFLFLVVLVALEEAHVRHQLVLEMLEDILHQKEIMEEVQELTFLLLMPEEEVVEQVR
jgi:hypothetical protein